MCLTLNVLSFESLGEKAEGPRPRAQQAISDQPGFPGCFFYACSISVEVNKPHCLQKSFPIAICTLLQMAQCVCGYSCRIANGKELYESGLPN